MPWTRSPYLHRDSFGVLGVNAWVAGDADRWKVGLFARNLLNQFYPGR